MASYELDIEQWKTFKVDTNGERTLLCNFVAEITDETRYVDGRTTETVLTISATTKDDDGEPLKFPPTEIPAQNFAGLQWIMQSWGVRAVIQPGSSVKDDLRTAIQINSRPNIKTIYRHIGWTKIDNKPAYLHGDGAITKNGNNPKVTVRLPLELSRFSLLHDKDANLDDAINATLQLTDLAPKPVAWTLLAATVAPPATSVDFAIHLTGRTGTFKSELISLFQSHYGKTMDARHLPGSWSSTPNALEAQAYFAKNAAFTIDDFVPTGTSWQVRTYQTTADKIIRAQGNQSGRARLTDTSSLQTAMFPRGVILSTGEDTPEGHSVRARMMILELSPGDIDPQKLTRSQADRDLFPVTMAAYIKYLCETPAEIQQDADIVRNEHLDIGHSRTPSMFGVLIASINNFLTWCQLETGLSDDSTNQLKKDAYESIHKAATDQMQYLESADPCEVFCQTIRNLLGAGLGHFRTLDGGIPANPTLLGWTEENSLGDVPTYKSHGPCIGWIKWNDDELFIDIASGYNVIKKAAGTEAPLTKQTMVKRLKDAGLLTRTDEARQRNTVRINAEKHPRQVLALSISTVLQTQEAQNDDQ